MFHPSQCPTVQGAAIQRNGPSLLSKVDIRAIARKGVGGVRWKTLVILSLWQTTCPVTASPCGPKSAHSSDGWWGEGRRRGMQNWQSNMAQGAVSGLED